MDAGIGIGGLGVEKDEFVDSKFDLFGKTDLNLQLLVKDLSHSLFQAILISLQMQKVYVCMEKCVL